MPETILIDPRSVHPTRIGKFKRSTLAFLNKMWRTGKFDSVPLPILLQDEHGTIHLGDGNHRMLFAQRRRTRTKAILYRPGERVQINDESRLVSDFTIDQIRDFEQTADKQGHSTFDDFAK